MLGRPFAVLFAAFVGLFPANVLAADYLDNPSNICVPLTPATKLTMISDTATLTELVVEMMNEAVAVSEDPEWIDNSRPAFVWASEAKVACGKAYGYLQSDFRDEQYLNKCECFFNRMRAYQY